MTRTKRITATLAGLVLTATLAACADQGATPPAATTSPTGSTSATATESESASASASSEVSADHNDQDTTFAQMMIIHHEGAIEMSQLAIERAESPEVVALAERIAEAIAAGGSTLRDYVGSDGSPGHFQKGAAVYGREGDGYNTRKGKKSSVWSRLRTSRPPSCRAWSTRVVRNLGGCFSQGKPAMPDLRSRCYCHAPHAEAHLCGQHAVDADP